MNRDITKIDNEACLTFFRYNWSDKNNLSGKILREKMYMPRSLDSLSSTIKWSRELGKYSINWGQILSNTFTGVTNNYKLIQFQYKLLLRISTCKYMRFKINIFKYNDQCGLSNGALKTLEHIFLYCPNTKICNRSLNIYIRHKICRQYRDINNYYLVICYHSNPLINYLNNTAKYK